MSSDLKRLVRLAEAEGWRDTIEALEVQEGGEARSVSEFGMLREVVARMEAQFSRYNPPPTHYVCEGSSALKATMEEAILDGFNLWSEQFLPEDGPPLLKVEAYRPVSDERLEDLLADVFGGSILIPSQSEEGLAQALKSTIRDYSSFELVSSSRVERHEVWDLCIELTEEKSLWEAAKARAYSKSATSI